MYYHTTLQFVLSCYDLILVFRMQSVILNAVVPFAQHTLVSHTRTRALHQQLVNADRLSAPAPPTYSQRLLKLPSYF